jgi:hypothetical protein
MKGVFLLAWLCFVTLGQSVAGEPKQTDPPTKPKLTERYSC